MFQKISGTKKFIHKKGILLSSVEFFVSQCQENSLSKNSVIENFHAQEEGIIVLSKKFFSEDRKIFKVVPSVIQKFPVWIKFYG